MRHTLPALLFTLFLAAPASARAPTPEETGRIEAALRAAGYVTWGTVEVGSQGEPIRVTAARRTSEGPASEVVVEPTTMRVTEETASQGAG
ncbi:hypothetical protein ACE7GA_09535 [Roseomonas sp. CCTCC AB2023176]|uniref:hypothetical protein n=1 Tax=Roseomonas sp. CCTCC AB2023176 TaxID=3342640 RepID=UPI0035D8F0A7